MIRFLILCTLFFLLYLGFSAIGEFDSTINLSVYGYTIETTLFAFGAIFLTLTLILLIALRLIFLVFDLPTIIRKQWFKRKLKHVNAKLLGAIAELMMGNRQKSVEMTTRILPELEEENKNLVTLIKATGEDSFDKKVSYLRYLVDKKHYSIYAARTLAEIFFSNSQYHEAEGYAVKAFNEDDTDTGIMLILIKIYAKLAMWPKMVFIVSKLQRADNKLLLSHAEEIAVYYYNAARDALESGDDVEAVKFLQSSLELKPDYIDALILFTELNINMQNTASILTVLKAAFIARPCFEIALMYIKSCKSSVNAIYGTLASIVKPGEHNELFLALAAYLDLPDKIKEIKESKLI